jgi:hypothetical protein
VRRLPWLFRSRDVAVAAAPKPLDPRQAEDDDEVEQEYDGGGETDAARVVAHDDCRDAHRCGMWVAAGFKRARRFSPLCLSVLGFSLMWVGAAARPTLHPYPKYIKFATMNYS